MSWASRQNLLARAVNRNLGGVPVIWGAISGEGILESNAELVSGGNVISVEYVLSNLPVAQFGAIGYGNTLLVGGEVFEVREAPFVVGDGAFCSLILSKADESTMPVPERPVNEVRIDTSTAGVIYVGQAFYGKEETDAAWTITRSTYSPAGIRTSKGTATGVTWTDRTTHTYV
jgi:hypothetical protein